MRTDEELSNFETVMAFFASFVLESHLVRQIMRWDMAVLSESPWYQEILKQGQALGIPQGIQQAIEVGLEFKFGSEGLQLMPEISQISDLERLTAIQRSLLTANTVDELRRLI